MFGFLKKKVTTRDIALSVLMERGDDPDGIERAVDSLITKAPAYAPRRAALLDEMQWLPKAAGLIAVRILWNHETSAAVRSEILAFYGAARDEDGAAIFPPEVVAGLARRLDAYSVRFNRGLFFRPTAQEGIAEAITDVANEAMEYFTGQPRATRVDEFSLHELQQRTVVPDILERHVAEYLGECVVNHLKRLQRVRLVA